MDDTNFLDQTNDQLVNTMLQEDPFFAKDSSTIVSPMVAPQVGAKVALDSQTANERAARYAFATKDLNYATPEIFQGALVAGEDSRLRQDYANMDVIRQERAGQEQLANMIANKPPGEDFTTEDIAKATQWSLPKTSNPQTVFESNYAVQAIDLATTQPSEVGHTILDASDVNKTIADDTVRVARELITGQQIATSKLEEVESRLKEQGLLGKALDFGEYFIPFASAIRTYNALEEAGATSYLPGNRLEEMIQYYYSLPTDQQPEVLQKALDSMALANNPHAARDFLHKLIAYSGDTQTWNNLSPIVDASLVAPLGKVPNALGALKDNLKAVTVAVGKPKTTVGQALSELGETAEAGFAKAREMVAKESVGTPPLNTMSSLDGEALRILQPETTVGGPSSSLSRPLASELGAMLNQNAQRFYSEVLGAPLRVDRLRDGTLQAAKDEAERVFRVQYVQANDTIHDVAVANKADNLTNNDFIEVTLGRTNKELFESGSEADIFAKEVLGLEDFNVRQLGDKKFAVIVTKPVDEASTLVRSQLEIQSKNATPVSRTNMFLGWLRGRDYVIGSEMATDLKIATYGGSQLQKVAKAMYNEVGQLSKGEYGQMVKFLKAQQNKTNPDGQRGVWSNTLGEFERDWAAYHGAPPSDKQAKAYFTHVQLNDMDWVMRNLNVYTAKTRKGIENFDVKIAPDLTVQGIEGKFLTEFPWDKKGNAGMVILDSQTAGSGKDILFRSRFLDAEKRKIIDESIKSGEYKVIQLTPEGARVLKGHPALEENLVDKVINYALVGNHITKKLPLKQIPYRPGGHVEYTNGSYFLRQAEIETVKGSTGSYRSYKGDKTLLAFDTKAKADKWLPKYEEARRMYSEFKNGRMAEAQVQAYVEQNLPDGWKKFKGMFNSKKENGLALDPHEPFMVSAKGESLNDAHGLANRYKDNLEFLDEGLSPHALLGPEDGVRYTGERDGVLMSVKEYGTEANPGIDLRPATLLDPMSTTSNAITSLMKGKYLDDVKIKYAEHFLAEFGDVLEDAYKVNIRDPFSGLMDAKFKTGYADRERLAAAKNYRRSMVEFLNLKSEGQRDLEWVTQKLADSIYTRQGDKALDIVAPHLLHREKDPVKFVKGFAFHTKLGFFNPKQLFMQAQGVTHIAGIEGIGNANKAFGAGMLQMARGFTDSKNILAHLDDMTTPLGWNKEHFIEATQGLMKSGFGNVGREVALQAGFASPRLVDSTYGKFLDAGTFFFNKGEQTVRTTAWNAAYLRWRGANPKAAFDDKAIKEVLARADLLTVNMSHASNSSWNYGWKSVPTQFFSYRTRMMEQFLGKQLTREEKARLFLTNSALYGIPAAATVPLALYPVASEVRQWMQRNQINPDDNTITKFLNDGVISNIMQAINGGEDTNIEDVYGPGAITQFHDLFTSEKSWAEVMGGVSGTVFGDLYKNSAPLVSSVWDTLTDTAKPGNKVTTQDVVDFAQSVSTLGQATKAIYAANYGKFYAKNQGTLVNVDSGVVGATLYGLLGISPQAIHNMYDTLDNLQAREEIAKRAEKEATKYYRLGWEAMANKDNESAQKYFDKAKEVFDWSDVNFKERARIFRNATRDSQSSVDSIDWKWAQTTKENMDRYIKDKALKENK